jgi:hypothetical protein
VIVQRLSGWLGGGARTLVLLVLTFAPLVCLRFCQLQHARAAHAPPHILCGEDTPPIDDSLLHDVQQLLSALTEFIPAAALLVFALLALPRPAVVVLRTFAPHRRVPTPPPRLRCA